MFSNKKNTNGDDIMSDTELKSYITTYSVEYKVELNDFTSVIIHTKYTNPSMIARPSDRNEVAKVDYENTKNTNLRTLITKFKRI